MGPSATLLALISFTLLVTSCFSVNIKFYAKDSEHLKGDDEWRQQMYYQHIPQSVGGLFVDEPEKVPKDWWQKTVMYQVYPRSFKDSDGDGTGDLKGITQKLDHFVDLGAHSIWIQPFYPSGGADNGYDVSDFYGVDRLFGTMADFEELISEAHYRGLKILLDFVPNHSSDENPWFQKSINKEDPYTNYYVWKDGILNSSTNKYDPPNNWVGIFGGSAWTWNEKRQQFYLHQFSEKQPDLNMRDSKCKEEMSKVLTFWLDKGIDGWRIDALKHLYEAEHFQDEPYLPGYEKGDLNYGHLNHTYTVDQPELYDILVEWRALIDSYANKTDKISRILVIESYTEIDKTMEYFNPGGRKGAHLPFNFQFVGLSTSPNKNSNATDISRSIHNWMDNMPKGETANWVYDNHDNPRITKRLGKEMADGMAMLGLLLPGVGVIYYGDEIGMTDNEIIRENQRQDPNNAGGDRLDETRDPERTPFQWDNTLNAGFSTAKSTWLPINPDYWTINLKTEMSKSWGTYKLFKALINLRKTDTIVYGDYATQILNNQWVLVMRRFLKSHDTYIVLINLNSNPEEVNPGSIDGLSENDLYIAVPSKNSGYKIGDKISKQDFKTKIYLRPKGSLVLIQTANGQEPILDKVDQENVPRKTSAASLRSILSFMSLILTTISLHGF